MCYLHNINIYYGFSMIVNVAAGILCNGQQILLTSRPLSKSYAGYWEFPGGKIEPGENKVEALIRELDEELGVKVVADNCKFFTTLLQEYDDKKVNLEIILVDKWDGELTACENQELYFHTLGEKIIKSPCLPTTTKILALLEQQ